MKPLTMHSAAMVFKPLYANKRQDIIEGSADHQFPIVRKDDEKNDSDESPEPIRSCKEEDKHANFTFSDYVLEKPCKNCAELQKQVRELTTRNKDICDERIRFHMKAKNHLTEQKRRIKAEIAKRSHTHMYRLEQIEELDQLLLQKETEFKQLQKKHGE